MKRVTFHWVSIVFGLGVLVPGTATVLRSQTPSGALPTLTNEQRGDLYMARKMYREAIDTYRLGAQNSAIMWDKIGIAYHQLGDMNDARKSYERAIKIDKQYADAINNVGTIFYAEKKYRSAISRYQRALKYAPDSASIWSNLGTAYYARGKFEEMTQAYSKALQLDPEVFEKHGSVGTRMQDRGVADKARYHYEMARMYALSGKNDLAIQYLRKALEEGFKEKEKLQQAKEFATLRETQEFKELMTLEPRVL
jgi:tetratricopeptide (TPR) repeat protein